MIEKAHREDRPTKLYPAVDVINALCPYGALNVTPTGLQGNTLFFQLLSVPVENFFHHF